MTALPGPCQRPHTWSQTDLQGGPPERVQWVRVTGVAGFKLFVRN